MNLLSEIIINENKNNIDKGVYKVDSEAIEKVEKIEDIKLEKEDNKNYNEELEIVESNIDNNNINEIVKKSVDKSRENIEEKLQNDQTIILKSINDIEEYNDDTIGGQLVTGLKNNIKKTNSSSNKDKKVIFVKDEMFKINTKITYEYNKTIRQLDFSKIREYRIQDDDKTISFLFYENDFYAVNRVNYKDGYIYSEKVDKQPISENLNNKIRKIPNVAKARNILNIQNIEARIYDMTEYILLLERKNIRVIKVKENGNLTEMNFSEYPIDRKKLKFSVEKLSFAYAERKREEKSIKNKVDIFKKSIKKHVINPIKEVLAKMGLINDVKLLADGKQSVFDKKM